MTNAPKVAVTFLPNLRMRNRLAQFRPGTGPDLRREWDGFRQHGVDRSERDLSGGLLNPLASRGTFYAGFDPLRALRVLLFDRRRDVIVSVFETNVVFILLLRRILRFKPKIVVWEVSARGWPVRDRVMDYVLPRVDGILALTSHQKRVVERSYRLRGPVQRIGFAVDDVFYRPLPSVDGRYVLAVGDDVGRDYERLVQACVRAKLPLLLRTRLPVAVPPGAESLVTILTDRISYPELRALYAAATIVAIPLHPCDHPSGITALFEGLAMGRPVVASDTGGARDVVSHGLTGMLVPPADTGALATSLAQLWNDRELQARLGCAARASIEGEFSYERYIAAFSSALISVKHPAQRCAEADPDSDHAASRMMR